VTTVAWVSGDPLEVSDVDELEAGLRSGPVAATLPRPGTREGRQLRRWLVQVLVAERLVAAEARVRGIGAEGAPALASLAPDRAALLALGSVAADLLTRSPLARAVFAAVTEEVSVDAAEVERYYRANPEGYRVPEERVVRSRHRDEQTGPVFAAPAEVRTLPRREPTGNAVFAARPDDTIGPAEAADPQPTPGPLRTQRREDPTSPVEDAAFTAQPGDAMGSAEVAEARPGITDPLRTSRRAEPTDDTVVAAQPDDIIDTAEIGGAPPENFGPLRTLRHGELTGPVEDATDVPPKTHGPLRTQRREEPTSPVEDAAFTAQPGDAMGSAEVAEAQPGIADPIDDTVCTARHGKVVGPTGVADVRVGTTGPLRTLRRGELAGPVEDAVFAALPGDIVGPVEDPLGRHTYEVVEVRPARVRPLAEAGPEIEARLTSAARRRAFTAWLDGHAAARVRLAPGFEHPGDPRQPDNTHRH
jgi:[acyl-carrier-protein] S-malonyltransferase